MNREQWHLLARMNPTWGRLWLIADYETARQYIVGTGHSMTGEVQGQWHETSAKGIRTLDRVGGTVLVDLPWSVVRDWSNGLDDATHERAEQLQAEADQLVHDAARGDIHETRTRENKATVRAFLDALGPTDEPIDLLDLLNGMG